VEVDKVNPDPPRTSSGRSGSGLSAVLGPLHVAAEAFNTQYGGLSVRTSDAFHDRFVVVDSTEFYHLGA